jgi:hypothetical protein
MRTLIQSAIVNSILAVLSVAALIFLFLALSDIADHEPNLTLEWYVAGICLFILAAFIISTIVTLVLLFKYLARKAESKKQSQNS